MKNLKIFGDSILRGVMYSENEKRYRLCDDNKFKSFAEHGIQVDNNSKMGCTIDTGAKLIEKRLADCSNDTTVLIELGGNDCDYDWAAISEDPDGSFLCKTPEDEFVNKYGKAITAAREKGAEVVVSSLVPIDPDKYFNWISKELCPDNIMKWLGDKSVLYRWQEHYDRLVRQIADKFGCRVIDLRTPFLLSHDYKNLLCADGIHPTEKGHKLIRKTLLENACA